MNLVEHTITAILSEPYRYENGYWVVRIEYDCWEHVRVENHLCWTEEEAKNLKVGDKFIA